MKSEGKTHVGEGDGKKEHHAAKPREKHQKGSGNDESASGVTAWEGLVVRFFLLNKRGDACAVGVIRSRLVDKIPQKIDEQKSQRRKEEYQKNFLLFAYSKKHVQNQAKIGEHEKSRQK